MKNSWRRLVMAAAGESSPRSRRHEFTRDELTTILEALQVPRVGWTHLSKGDFRRSIRDQVGLEHSTEPFDEQELRTIHTTLTETTDA